MGERREGKGKWERGGERDYGKRQKGEMEGKVK